MGGEIKKQRRLNRNSFPTSIEPLKGVVMTALFSGKQTEFKNLAEALEAITLDAKIRHLGMSYVVIKY